MEKEIFGKVDQYISKLVGDEDEILRATDRSIQEAGMPPISVSPNQGKFLNILAKTCNAKKILEVGTLAGYSTIWMARALPPTGRLITLEYESKHASVARKNIEHAGLSSLVEIRVGKAIELLPEIHKRAEGPFDMIFIDADKEPYTEYFQWALKLSRSGTLIVTDNVVREGKILDPNSTDEMVRGVQRFNTFLGSCKEVTSTILQTVGSKMHDGIALSIVN